jgi:hypothetical protein
MIVANDQRREHSENWLYYSGEQSSEEQNFEIPGKSLCIQNKEI